jgi:serine phosphatase RsbU (regulator of sigma subunit)
MFGSTPTKSEALFRRQATRIRRRVTAIWRQASLRLTVLLYGERVDPETLAVTLDGERHLIMGLWSQLAVQSSADGESGERGEGGTGRGGDGATRPDEIPLVSLPHHPPLALSPRVPDAELATAVELCLSRMLETLARLPADRIHDPVLDPSQFAFARTLAEFGHREGLPLEQLLADLLLLREALRRHLFRYPLSARIARCLVDPFLDRAAVALTREWSALAEEIASREAEHTSGLLTITGETLTSLDPAVALQAVVNQARHSLGVDLAALLMLSPDRESLELVAVAGDESELEPRRRLSVAGSISGQAIRTGRPFTCLDTLAGGVEPVGHRHLVGTPAASAVSAPVDNGGELVGALEVCTASRRIFEPHETDRLALLAGQAGLVWQHDALQRQARERERAAALREIDVARRVQSSLLGRNTLAVGPFRLGARLEPSREVGGDYYDLFPLDGDRAAIHIGDVSGKGIPAALLVAMARYSLRARATTPGASTADVMRETNALFCADLSEDMVMFVTACYAVLESNPPRLVYASAGHHPPMIRRGNVVQVSTIERQAPPLGLARGGEFRDRHVSLAAGDVLVFYTDGVIEARNSLGEWFGLTGLERTLRAHSDDDPEELATAIVDAVIAHMAGQPLSDDTTVVVLKVGG